MATLGLPGIGYGIRYEYGMFRQEFRDGWQIEEPDDWLVEPDPWEIPRPERCYRVSFGGHVEHRGFRAHWISDEEIFATAYDRLVAGHNGTCVSTLRLWSPRPMRPIDLGAFNRGAFLEALAPKVHARTVARVLYPDDSTAEGRELRLRQQYFFVSASVQDALARFLAQHGDLSLLPDNVAIHLNDTHPSLAPVELMRLLVDQHRLDWDVAWQITQRICAYTNHTLMPEALEVWPVEMLRRVVPRHLEIIEEIESRFLRQVENQHGGARLVSDLHLIEDQGGRRVNMGRVSVLSCGRTNGVSKLHSRLVRVGLFSEFARLYPERFCNVTNGIAMRRWLIHSNPALSALIDEAIGPAWRSDFTHLHELGRYIDDGELCERVRRIKLANKERLVKLIADRTGVRVDPRAICDVQIKRIHEYKRQLLNILGVIARWNAIRAEPHRDWAPRVVVLSGKAASAYWLAKLIIKLAHDVAATINSDPQTREYLQLVFLPNYGVSLAEVIVPAADLSQQISLAGTEASGTGNMKMAVNGALTLGTADGANIEIAEAIGPESFITFGLGVDEVTRMRANGYYPGSIHAQNPRLREVIDQIAVGAFSPEEPGRHRPIVDSLLLHGDRYMVLADFAAYWDAQLRIDEFWQTPVDWNRRAVRSISDMGSFSSDRAIREYAQCIWNAGTLGPLPREVEARAAAGSRHQQA